MKLLLRNPVLTTPFFCTSDVTTCFQLLFWKPSCCSFFDRCILTAYLVLVGAGCVVVNIVHVCVVCLITETVKGRCETITALQAVCPPRKYVQGSLWNWLPMKLTHNKCAHKTSQAWEESLVSHLVGQWTCCPNEIDSQQMCTQNMSSMRPCIMQIDSEWMAYNFKDSKDIQNHWKDYMHTSNIFILPPKTTIHWMHPILPWPCDGCWISIWPQVCP